MNQNSGEIIKSGELLLIQGEKPRFIYILKSGTLEILGAPQEFSGLDKDIIISKSRRLGLIKNGSMAFGLSSQMCDPYLNSVRAVEDCSVLKYPIRGEGINSIASQDPAQAVAIIKHLRRSYDNSVKDIIQHIKLHNNIARVVDNLAIAAAALSGADIPGKIGDRADDLMKKYLEAGKIIPGQITINFIVQDNSSAIGGAIIDESLTKCDDFSDFSTRLLKLDSPVLAAMIKQDPQIASQLYLNIFTNYCNTLENIFRITDSIDSKLSEFLGQDASWSSFLADRGALSEWLNTEKIEENFLKNLLTLLVKMNSRYEEITGKKISTLYTGVKKLHDLSRLETPAEINLHPGESSASPSASRSSVTGTFKNSIHQICEFAIFEKEQRNLLIKHLNEFKNSKNPFNTESDGRKARRRISNLYWDLYKLAFIRSKTGTTIPRPVKLMLNYGYLDETLIEESQLIELNELAREREKPPKIPVLHETEFLSRIYSGEIQPSITEMGLDYPSHQREEERHKSKKEIIDTGLDENVKKTMHEIEHRLKSTAAVCSGSTATAFPILTSLAIKGPLKGFHISKEKIGTLFSQLKQIDFSVLYRETVLKMGESREIIQEEILPYIIILPIYGTRTLLWQDLSGTNKRTRGRIVIPIFFMGDLQRSLFHTFACFRWEINRSVKGPQWADPIDGGLTGEYFDYVNTYKKNSKLSAEAKEKIGERFKSFRTNRDRFADDYLNWIFYEREGIMKLNNVVRDMFFKYIPFQKETRQRLEQMPAFAHPATRYKNIHKRDVEAYQRRFKKYMDENSNYPEEIDRFFKFLDM